jgi:hypothetical protein
MRYGPILMLASLSCGPNGSAPQSNTRTPGSHSPDARIGVVAPLSQHNLTLTGVSGLSGIASAGQVLYIVPERTRSLVRLEGKQTTQLPIEGVDRRLELESVAWLGGNRLAFGTEPAGLEMGSAHPILFAHIHDGTVTIATETVELAPAMWGLRMVTNRGIEALCATPGALVAGLETPLIEAPRRYAPVGVYDRATRKWVAHRLSLTTATGKLSALDCRPGPNGTIRAYGVERHYGIARVLAFEIPSGNRPRTIVPSLVRNLDHIAAGKNYNVEGVAWHNDDLVLVIDNHYGRITGPNAVITLPGAAARSTQ